MENRLLLQTFYHGLSTNTRETMDAAAGGAFLSFTLTQATNLVEKMASNQAWNEERQPHKKQRGMHQLKEVDMLSANTTRDVLNNDNTISSQKTPKTSQLTFYDEFVTKMVLSLNERH
jgi:hypothetical protein